MKTEYDMAKLLVTFTNATLRRDSIIGVVTIPGAYPGQGARTRIITPGSFPVDVPESHPEALKRWRGGEGEEAARMHELMQQVEMLQTKVQVLTVMHQSPVSAFTLDELRRVYEAAKGVLEKP